MRKFVAGCCCLIVGLEVLIAVPLAVCLVFYGLVQGGGPIAMQVQPSSYDPATIPPLSYSTPQPYTPAVPVAAPMDCIPASPVPIPASYATTPPFPTRQPASNLDRSNDRAAGAAISEVRERIPNPLAGTFVAEESSVSEPADQPPAVTAGEPKAEGLVPTVAADGIPADSEAKPLQLIDSLTRSVQRLYALATDYEDQGNFGRADQVRKLAREIREEVEIIKLHDSHRCVSAEATPGPSEPGNSTSETGLPRPVAN